MFFLSRLKHSSTDELNTENKVLRSQSTIPIFVTSTNLVCIVDCSQLIHGIYTCTYFCNIYKFGIYSGLDTRFISRRKPRVMWSVIGTVSIPGYWAL